MGRIITLIYGACSYAVFFLTFLYAIGFIGNFGVPKSLDSGPAGSFGAALLLLFWHWQPLGGMVWQVGHPAGRALLYGGFGAGWALVLLATFVINHFDLFGLRQTWRHFRGMNQAPLQFVTPMLYRIVRHVPMLIPAWRPRAVRPEVGRHAKA